MVRALCALLFLCGISWPTLAEDSKRMTAILLVARAELPDPNFKDSVVLVMNQIGPGPLGVIINKPTKIPLSELFPDIENLAQLEEKVYFGGPVAMQVVSFVFRATKRPEGATEVVDGVFFSANGKLLRELLSRGKPVEGLRVFLGYAGWSEGQLEGEIARGDWNLAPARSSTVFDVKPERLWPELHRPGSGHRASAQDEIDYRAQASRFAHSGRAKAAF